MNIMMEQRTELSREGRNNMRGVRQTENGQDEEGRSFFPLLHLSLPENFSCLLSVFLTKM